VIRGETRSYWIVEFRYDDEGWEPGCVYMNEERARDCIPEPELTSGRARIVRVEVVEVLPSSA
jgi:hypothetical protein